MPAEKSLLKGESHLPEQVIADLLRDTHPDVDALLSELKIIEAANAGLIAARAKASNTNKQPGWLDEISKIISREFQRSASRLKP
jgi:hypothetical protein